MSTLALVRGSFSWSVFWVMDAAHGQDDPGPWRDGAVVAADERALAIRVRPGSETEVAVRLSTSLSTGDPVFRGSLPIPSGQLWFGDAHEDHHVDVAPGVYDVAVWVTTQAWTQQVEIVLSPARHC